MARKKKLQLALVPEAPPAPELKGALVDSIDDDTAALEAAAGAPAPELRNTPVPAEPEAPETTAEVLGTEILIPHERLRPPLVARDKGDLSDLTKSIRERGLDNAIVVTEVIEPDGSTAYRIVQGSRRSTANARAGNLVIRARVKVYASEAEEIVACADENMNRKDFAPLEEAAVFGKLVGLGVSIPRIAEQFNRTAPHVAARMRLLELSDECRAALAAGQITLQVALEIARIPSLDDQREVLGMVAGDDDGNPAAPIAEVRELINSQYRLKLDRAPWDLNDAKLVESAGPCSVCPKQTGAQTLLFPDAKTALCTDRACWRSKLDAFWTVRVLATPTTREHLVEGKKAEVALSSMLRLDGEHYHAGAQKVVSARHVFGDNVPPVTIARHPQTGEHIELVAKADFDRAAKDLYEQPETADPDGALGAGETATSEPAASAATTAVQDLGSQIQRKLKIEARAVDKASVRASREDISIALEVVARWLLATTHTTELAALAKARQAWGREKPWKTAELPEKLAGWLESLTSAEKTGLAVELVLRAAGTKAHAGSLAAKDVCARAFAAYSIDLAEIERAVEREERAELEPEPDKPSEKKKGGGGSRAKAGAK